MVWGFPEMSASQVEAAVERYYDRLLDDYLNGGEDAWDYYKPDWQDVYNLMEWYEDRIPDFVRDTIDGDGDTMMRCYEDGLLSEYINPALQMKDPDEVWHEIDRVFDRHWDDDEFMLKLWEKEYIYRPVCERLWQLAEDDVNDDIRETYNRQHEEDGYDD